MSNSTNPRVVRKHTPQKVFRKTQFREAWDFLALDFENRCAYSMQHTQLAGGKKCMEVDHFNPHKKQNKIQEYENLFLATRHCNGAKRDRWPSNKHRKLGVRFLNCCEELDYGLHIFEDPDTHEVVGVTPAGKYHVRNCDLNADHLVKERADRAKIWGILESIPVRLNKGWSLPPQASALKDIVTRMIPKIAYLSGKDLEQYRAQQLSSAKLLTNGSALP